MKAAQEKIHVEQLLGIYSLDQLQTYRQCPQVLAEELRDLETISLLAHSQFAEIVVDLRKKSLEYDKTFKICDKLARDIPEQIRMRRSVSNNNFAYSIHSLSAQSIISQFPQRRLLTELKLKFLQSQGVDENNWQNWFCPEEKVLLIKDYKNEFEIKLGMSLVDNSPSLTWEIFDATINSHHHPQLFFFLREYAHWMRLNHSDWEGIFIKKLQIILSNLPSIFLFLNMRDEIRRRDGEVDKETFKLAPIKNGNIKYMWNFDIFQHLDNPKVSFYVNQLTNFELQLKEGAYSGEIYIRQFADVIVLRHTQPIELLNPSFLYDFSMKFQKYCTILQKFREKYEKLSPSIIIFLKLDGLLWKPDNLTLKEEESLFQTDGIWAKVITENGVIIKIDEDMSLTYPQFQRGFFNHLLTKLSLPNLLIHIHLRNQILRSNRQFQFKIYRINYLQKQSEVVYEFRSYKYSEQQKIFKITRQQEQSMHMISEANDNFVLILKVASDFSRVSYSAYKYMEGAQNQQRVADNFLPKRWKQYRDNARERFDWRKICECITYLCKCYLVERSYNRRMTDEQRKMTVYNFK